MIFVPPCFSQGAGCVLRPCYMEWKPLSLASFPVYQRFLVTSNQSHVSQLRRLKQNPPLAVVIGQVSRPKHNYA